MASLQTVPAIPTGGLIIPAGTTSRHVHDLFRVRLDILAVNVTRSRFENVTNFSAEIHKAES